MNSARRKSYRYLLGDSRKEAARLRAQGRLWDPVAHALFDRLRIRRGWAVLELGPGQGSLHLELRKRVSGPVDYVERSPVFFKKLAALCARDGLGQGTAWNTDLMEAELPKNHYDLIFVRWVFLFLPQPEEHLKKLVAALKPGGVIAIQDYHRETFTLLPTLPDWSDFLLADRAFFASQGGDASIGGRLPHLFEQAGLRVLENSPTVKTGGPGSPVWSWLSDYFLGVLDRYATFRPLTPTKANRLRKLWLKAAQSKSSIMIAPTVVDVVGRKKR